jgi:hypothetical protein
LRVNKRKGENSWTRRKQVSALVDDRRQRLAALKVKGLSIRQIQAQLEKDEVFNPSTGRVWSIGILSEDLQFVDERWKAETLKDWGAWKKQELEKLDQIEREARTAWERGIGKKKKKIRERTIGGKDGGSSKVGLVTEELNGDPRYLQVMLDCQKRRAQMIGFDAALKSEHSGPGGGPIQITDAERAQKVEALLEATLARIGKEPKE